MEEMDLLTAEQIPPVAKGICLVCSIRMLGYEALLVGGCVRDLVRWKLGKANPLCLHDIDIATNMPAEELAKHFRTASNNGEKHGTILVFYDDEPFEVTRFRADGDYSDGRHPDSVEFADTFEEDSRRRDFTMNAMGMTGDGIVVDYHGGIQSIRDGILSTVGDPVARFNEDALRILRAGRFAARFGMSLDLVTLSACRALAPRLQFLSMERVHDELTKCDTPESFAGMLHFLKDGIGKHLSETVNWAAAARAVDNWKSCHQKPWDIVTAMAILFFSVEGDAEEEMRRFRCTLDEIGAYRFAREMHGKYHGGKMDLVDMVDLVRDRRWPHFVGVVNAYEGKCAIDSVQEEKLLRMWNSYPSTKDITTAMAEKGYQPGPGFGKTLRAVRLVAYKLMAGGKTMTPEELATLL